MSENFIHQTLTLYVRIISANSVNIQKYVKRKLITSHCGCTALIRQPSLMWVP